MPRQFDFLETFIHKVLDDAGFESMTETTRAQFVPMFVAEAERRLGLALLPMLNDAQAKQLAELANDGNTTPENLAQFWQESIPDFTNVVQATLDQFAQEFKKTLAGVTK
jgi:hypothetical protein